MNIRDKMIIRKDKDGTEYIFIWEAMKKAFDERKKEEGLSVDDMENKLAEIIEKSSETVKNHFRTRGKEAAEIITEANSLTAEVINSEQELNKNLSGKTEFTLWWD